MRVYFLSSEPCILNVNGERLGVVNGAPHYASLHPEESPFLEFVPPFGGTPVRFFFSDQLSTIPQTVDVYQADRFLVFYIRKFHRFCPLQLIASAPSVTVFSQGSPQALLNGKTVVDLPTDLSSCHIHSWGDVTLLEGRRSLVILKNQQKIAEFQPRTWNLDRETATLTAVVPLGDFRGRWANVFFNCNKDLLPTLLPIDNEEYAPLPDELILCDLIQKLQLNEDVTPLLHEELSAESEQLKGYFGEYFAVFPLSEPYYAGTACRGERPNVFSLKFYFAETKEGKISNIVRQG